MDAQIRDIDAKIADGKLVDHLLACLDNREQSQAAALILKGLCRGI
jgi:hypothetical protein